MHGNVKQGGGQFRHAPMTAHPTHNPVRCGAIAMSLTSELIRRDSPVKRFFRETFPNTRETLAQVRSALRGNELIHRLEPGAPTHAYSQIGAAIDYRIRYSFAYTLAHDLVAWKGAWAVSDLPPRMAWAISGMPPFPDMPENMPRLGTPEITAFFDQLKKTVTRIAPYRKPPKPSEERRLARFCLLLAVFESVYRSGARYWPPAFLRDELPASAIDLLSAVPDDWVEDLAALSTAFAERYPEWRGAAATLNPTFAGSIDIGGADADFILDGCLWEIKTTKTNVGKSVNIYQLLGYALLDYDDEFGIERVGLLFPRQDTAVQWPLPELIKTLSGRRDLDLRGLRQRFRAIIADSG